MKGFFDMKKQTRHVSLMFYTLFISVKETDGKGSKILMLLLLSYMHKRKSVLNYSEGLDLQSDPGRRISTCRICNSCNSFNHLIFLISKL